MGCCTAKGAKKEKEKENPPQPQEAPKSAPAGSNAPSPQRGADSQSSSAQRRPQNLSLEEEVPFETIVAKRMLKTHKNDHMTIITAYDVSDIVKLEMTPRGTIKKTVHFMCPVCQCYLNHILTATCCGHYLCLTCALSMMGGNGSVDLRCPQCNCDPVTFTDVDPARSIKVYSDTFMPNRITKSGDKRDAYGAVEELAVRDSPRLADPENESIPDNRV